MDNLPESFKILNCAENKITLLDNLPKSLIELYCNCNEITHLDNLPPSLTTFHYWLYNPINIVELYNKYSKIKLKCQY